MSECAAPSKSFRHWFRFSLRTLVVLMTILCVWLAWASYASRTSGALRTRHQAFAQALDDYRYTDAYQFMSPDFRHKFSVEEFYQMQDNPGMIYPFDGNADVQVILFSSNGYIGYEWYVNQWGYRRYRWTLVDEKWYYSGESQ